MRDFISSMPLFSIIEWIITAAVVILGALVAWRYLPFVGIGKIQEAASPDKRQAVYTSLLNEGGKITAPETGEFLLAIAVDLYNRKHDAFTNLDEKAQKLVALIGGGASLYALFAGFNGGIHFSLTPLLVLSAACFFTSLVLLLLSLRPVETDVLAITEFNSVPILKDPAFRARIALRLIEAWQEITFGLTPILRRKGRFIFAATLLIVVGASALLANFLILLATGQVSGPPK